MNDLTFTCTKCENELENFERGSGIYEKRCKKCIKNAKNSEYKKPKERDIVHTDFQSNDWAGGKIPGTVFQVGSTNLVSARLTITDKDGKKHQKTKSFDPKKYDSDVVKAISAGNEWRTIEARKLGLITNQYKLVSDQANIPKYVIFQLSAGYVGLFDIEDLNTLKHEILHVSKSGHQNSKEYAH